MNNYYYIPPKKPRVPKPITVLDIILLVAAIILGYLLIPIDLSAGIGGTSKERAEGIELLLREEGVEPGYFNDLFKTGTKSTFIQPDEKYGTYLLFKDGQYKSYDYENKKNTLFGNVSKKNVSAGFVSTAGLTSVTETGIYYENFKGFYGDFEIDVPDLLCTDGTFDYNKTTRLLAGGRDSKISLLNAAAIYHYIQNGTIVGYSDGVAWYVAENGEGGYQLIRDDIYDEPSIVENLGQYGQNVYVIENTYLMFAVDGDLFLHYDDDHKTTLDCGDDVIGLDYSVSDDGKIKIYAYTASQLYRFNLTGNGVEYEDLRVDKIDTPDGMYITTEWDKTLCWLRYGEEYFTCKD